MGGTGDQQLLEDGSIVRLKKALDYDRQVPFVIDQHQPGSSDGLIRQARFGMKGSSSTKQGRAF